MLGSDPRNLPAEWVETAERCSLAFVTISEKEGYVRRIKMPRICNSEQMRKKTKEFFEECHEMIDVLHLIQLHLLCFSERAFPIFVKQLTGRRGICRTENRGRPRRPASYRSGKSYGDERRNVDESGGCGRRRGLSGREQRAHDIVIVRFRNAQSADLARANPGSDFLVKGSHSIHLENCCAILEA